MTWEDLLFDPVLVAEMMHKIMGTASFSGRDTSAQSAGNRRRSVALHKERDPCILELKIQGFSTSTIAKKLGYNREYVSQRLKVINQEGHDDQKV